MVQTMVHIMVLIMVHITVLIMVHITVHAIVHATAHIQASINHVTHRATIHVVDQYICSAINVISCLLLYLY
jgi:hypothetical protein